MAVREIAQALFGSIWKLMLAVDYPGVGVSVAGVTIAFLLMRLSISLFKYIAGFSASGSDYGRATKQMDRYKAKQRKLRKQ